MPTLVLGSVSFADFELPEAIVFGGRQRLAVHALPGGELVIDALGRDDAPLVWTGVFSGPDATVRARTLDLMRAQGLPQQAFWDDFAYTVIVSDFAARYERATWVPYRITCTVLVDDTFVAAQVAVGIVGAIVGDLGAASGLGGIDVSGAIAAVGVPGAAVLGSVASAAAAASLTGAAGSVAQGLASSGAMLIGPGSFAAIAAAAQQAARCAAAQGYLQRARTNLANAET